MFSVSARTGVVVAPIIFGLGIPALAAASTLAHHLRKRGRFTFFLISGREGY
jgi:hypothetical protein